MTAHLQATCIQLDKTTCLRMTGAQGTAIVCHEGSLWITQDGSPCDVQLDAGQRFVVPDAAKVIVTGFVPSVASVLQPSRTPERVVRRPALWMRSLFAFGQPELGTPAQCGGTGRPV